MAVRPPNVVFTTETTVSTETDTEGERYALAEH